MANIAHSKDVIDNNFEIIIERIENGESLRQILKSIHVSSRTFFKWIEADSIKEKQYAQALVERAELKFESIESDYMEDPQRDPESGRIDSAWVALQRLKIDAKKWELSKLMPKKYGDKIENTHIIETPIFTGIDLDVPTNDGSE